MQQMRTILKRKGCLMRKPMRKNAKSRQAKALPQWMLEAMNQPACGPENFRFRREFMLGMSIEQCAEWLQTHRTTVARWEKGEAKIPFAAFEAMRLLYEHATYQRQHDKWQGWQFTKAGEFVNPDGTLIFTPERLLAVASAFRMAAYMESDNTRLKKELGAANDEIERLRVENLQLRKMAAADTMLDELHSIRGHIDSLLSLVDRAEVYQFPAGRVAA